jgi:glycosyltransferase involved in cell wall biosynthesis
MSAPAIPEIVFVTDSVPWFGRHTGFDRLPHLLDPARYRIQIISPKRSLLSRAVGKIVSTVRGHGNIAQEKTYARARAELLMRMDGSRLAHLVYSELDLVYWKDVPPGVRERTLLSFHQPPGEWDEEMKAALPYYSHAHILWQRDLDWFQSHLKNGKLTFIPHGVDTEFFSPGPMPQTEPPPFRMLYAGVHLRNLAMLKRVVLKLGEYRKDIHFDFLVPVSRRGEPHLTDLQGHPSVTWHANLSDEQLRDLYRQSYLMVLPMDQSGANTAVLEAISCGLPPVTTDVGGIRDYGGGSVYPVVANNDDDAMIALIESYVADLALRQKASAACRTFVETNLAWPLIIQKHVELYRELAA